jgi:CHASE2 domain-containing sensor protein
LTHFKSDRRDYFEFKIDLFENRGNETERIYFTDPHKSFGRWELSNIAFIPEYFQEKTVLVGYLGDYLIDSTYYYPNMRKTPMNPYHGDELYPDMFDTELSAIIINQFREKVYLNEVGQFPRVFLIFLFSLVNVVLLTFIKTKSKVFNILIAAILFLLLCVASSALVVFSFTKDYYLALDELPLIFLIVTIFTVGLNLFEKKRLVAREERTTNNE